MPMFFFDFCQGSEIDRDDSGLPFDTADQAYLQAYEAATAMWSELLRQRQDPRRCAFQVRDEHERMLFHLPFVELLDACKDRVHLTKQFVDTYRAAHVMATRTRGLSSDLGRSVASARRTLDETRRLVASPLGVWGETGTAVDQARS